MILCRKRITPDPKKPRLETYCMLPWGHKGECSIHPYQNVCWLCKPEQSFESIIKLQEHVKDIHRVWKG